MTNTIKVKPYNPVKELHSDVEIIDFLVDCYKEDSEGLTLARGMAFAMDSIGEPKTALLMIYVGMRLGREAAAQDKRINFSRSAPAI